MKEYNTNRELFYEDLPDEVDIVGISFRTAGKIYYFSSNGIICKEGQHAIVETARGAEYGIVSSANHLVPKNELILPLRTVLRVATPEDDKRFELNSKKEEEAFEIALKKIEDHKLDMKLVDVEYTFDNSKLLFYFTADDRVDFRELVKDLASVFRTRIELRQIGIRDEAKMMGGLGICGREFCCHSFLGDFAQVTIKMAKEQNLSLNASKISGTCGKLMCCLRFEHESYQQEIALTPKVDTQVTTPDGPGVVVSNDPLKGICNVRLNRTTDGTITPYHRDLLNRPENPTTDVIPPAPKAPERSKKEEEPKPVQLHSNERPPARHEPKVETAKHEIEEAEEISDKIDHNEHRGVRPHHNRGDRNKKRNDFKNDTKKDQPNENKADPKQELSAAVQEQKTEAAPSLQQKSKHPQKSHRPHHAEKKSESKFDAKFAGGQSVAEIKNEPKSDVKAEAKPEAKHTDKNSKSHFSDHRPHHRRPHHGDKKADKKVQKTENNN